MVILKRTTGIQILTQQEGKFCADLSEIFYIHFVKKIKNKETKLRDNQGTLTLRSELKVKFTHRIISSNRGPIMPHSPTSPNSPTLIELRKSAQMPTRSNHGIKIFTTSRLKLTSRFCVGVSKYFGS